VTPTDLAILEADGWFGQIPPGRRALLLEGSQVRSVAAGARLYGAGDPPNGLWAVIEGQVRLKGYPAVGLELLIPILQPGTWFGETSTLDGLPRPTDAIAFEPARVLHVSMAAFAHAADAAPKLYHDLGILACQHQRVALGFIAQTVANPVRVRLALLLAGQTDESGGVVRIRQEDLAGLVGVSRQTLNRHLNALEREGIVALAYAEITVRDLPRLLAVAGVRRPARA
jgi:CRP-like cAMP-binding protein